MLFGLTKRGLLVQAIRQWADLSIAGLELRACAHSARSNLAVMPRTITGLFDHYEDAQRAAAELERAGVPEDDISIVANNAHGHHDGVGRSHDDAADDAGKGAASVRPLAELAGCWPGSAYWPSRVLVPSLRQVGWSRPSLARLVVPRWEPPRAAL